jgi:hypothetical protein
MRSWRHTMQLTVAEAEDADCFKDIARINFSDRSNFGTGHIHKIAVGDRQGYFILRGLAQRSKGKILLDRPSRQRLNVEMGRDYEFVISSVGWWGELRWAFRATEPAYRISTQLGILSFFLGVLSLVLAVLPLITPLLGSLWDRLFRLLQ